MDKINTILLVFLCVSFQIFSQQNPVLVSEVDTTNIKVGEQINYKIQINLDTIVDVKWGENKFSAPFEIIEEFEIDTINGETIKEKRTGKTFKVLKKQIQASLNKKQNLNKLIIAYEPVWSIGTNKVPNVITLKKTINFIKNEFKKILKKKKEPVVLYGGSVNDKNIRIFSKLSEIDGFLIGGASQSSKKFIDIIKNYYK